jgi:sn-glycerol 3-phosphate transport system permease protein
MAMVERQGWALRATHGLLVLGIFATGFPIWLAFVASTVSQPEIVRPPMPLLPGGHLLENYERALLAGVNVPVWRMLLNSFVMALGITVGKIAISLLSAFAIVYFRFPGRMLAFWAIFVTLMLPVEVRILPTYEVVAGFGMLNSYTGLVLPLIASATATFLFRQLFLTIPDELAEAARIDGAGPVRFFRDILLPLSRTNMAALFVILFIYGWNQYLWPLLVTTGEQMTTIVMGIKRMANVADSTPVWHEVMAVATLALVPPVVVIVVMQRWFIKGLIETEK